MNHKEPEALELQQARIWRSIERAQRRVNVSKRQWCWEGWQNSFVDSTKWIGCMTKIKKKIVKFWKVAQKKYFIKFRGACSQKQDVISENVLKKLQKCSRILAKFRRILETALRKSKTYLLSHILQIVPKERLEYLILWWKPFGGQRGRSLNHVQQTAWCATLCKKTQYKF